MEFFGFNIPTPAPVWTKCCTSGCCMVHGHGGPHRAYNGLAFSTNRRKARQAEKVVRDLPAAPEMGQ